jgi:hypothetical protein
MRTTRQSSGRLSKTRVVAYLAQGSIWTSVHFVLTFFWLSMAPAMIFLGWWKSVEFLAVVSVYANVVGHWSAWQAARSEEQSEQK